MTFGLHGGTYPQLRTMHVRMHQQEWPAAGKRLQNGQLCRKSLVYTTGGIPRQRRFDFYSYDIHGTVKTVEPTSDNPYLLRKWGIWKTSVIPKHPLSLYQVSPGPARSPPTQICPVHSLCYHPGPGCCRGHVPVAKIPRGLPVSLVLAPVSTPLFKIPIKVHTRFYHPPPWNPSVIHSQQGSPRGCDLALINVSSP